ncbi:MAG: immunoglobulin-like domain-containing protein [Alkalibacterium sp.]|uniref:immunoglobulin-like domain-containing protein n=1 Tax=Alkalibacterium sp. TaxID=1872447 RepID=UPI00397106B4
MNNKRNAIHYIILSSSLIFIGGCSANNAEPSPYEEVNTLENVEIALEKDEYRPKDDTFILNTINESEDDISYGIAFTLEKEKDNTWFMVEPDEEIAFILIAHILGPGEEAQEELNMEYYEPLDTAKYRIVREIEGEVLTAEFEVK